MSTVLWTPQKQLKTVIRKRLAFVAKVSVKLIVQETDDISNKLLFCIHCIVPSKARK